MFSGRRGLITLLHTFLISVPTQTVGLRLFLMALSGFQYPTTNYRLSALYQFEIFATKAQRTLRNAFLIATCCLSKFMAMYSLT